MVQCLCISLEVLSVTASACGCTSSCWEKVPTYASIFFYYLFNAVIQVVIYDNFKMKGKQEKSIC